MDHDQYCREVESHLCRKNDGHLIRIAGPSFELVCGWAKRGIPLNVVRRGIDRCVERYCARGPRRRPVRIDFCEADVLDTFDDWRRAVGIFHQVVPEPGGEHIPAPVKPRYSLAAHIDRVTGRLVARQTDTGTPELNREIARAIEHLDDMRDKAAKARGAARARLIDQLANLDGALAAVAHQTSSAELREELARETAVELEPFRQRMTAPVYQQAVDSAVDRLLRERLGLPRLAYDA